MDSGAQPTQPWQVTRRHAALTAAELHNVRQRGVDSGFAHSKSAGGKFENRHTVQQQIITQQRKMLKEQQEEIEHLKKEQSMMGFELEMKKTAKLSQLSIRGGLRPKSLHFDPSERR